MQEKKDVNKMIKWEEEEENCLFVCLVLVVLMSGQGVLDRRENEG